MAGVVCQAQTRPLRVACWDGDHHALLYLHPDTQHITQHTSSNMATLISIPAGRSFRRTGTKWVDPQPEKGLIELAYQDDLMHLCELVHPA